MKKEKTLSEKGIEIEVDLDEEGYGTIYYDKDVKQFIKKLKEFIKERTHIKQGVPPIVKFMPFEFEDFLKEKAGFEELE